jgi:hypothetical protein
MIDQLPRDFCVVNERRPMERLCGHCITLRGRIRSHWLHILQSRVEQTRQVEI